MLPAPDKRMRCQTVSPLRDRRRSVSEPAPLPQRNTADNAHLGSRVRCLLFHGKEVEHDYDATFELLVSRGAEVSQEPIDQPYGVRDCAFRDPAGNEIKIQQTA